MKCYTVIVKKIHADLMTFFFFLVNQLSHDHGRDLPVQSQNGPVAVSLLEPQGAPVSTHSCQTITGYRVPTEVFVK